MSVGAVALGARLGRFILGFTFVFWLSYLCWIIGSWAYIAATTDKLGVYKIWWSLSLTAEAGFLVALIAGLIVGNLFPALVEATREAIRPEWYIKTAIVILGGFLGVKAAEQLGLATAVMFRGLCAIVEAYLIYWALVYFVARKYFKFSREWAAPLASGISICGVSAAIATGGAIKARPIVPDHGLVARRVFSVRGAADPALRGPAVPLHEPMVAGGLDGTGRQDGRRRRGQRRHHRRADPRQGAGRQGVKYQEGWMVGTTTTVKVFIDVFIGVWAFILAVIWTSVDRATAGRTRAAGARSGNVFRSSSSATCSRSSSSC